MLARIPRQVKQMMALGALIGLVAGIASISYTQGQTSQQRSVVVSMERESEAAPVDIAPAAKARTKPARAPSRRVDNNEEPVGRRPRNRRRPPPESESEDERTATTEKPSNLRRKTNDVADSSEDSEFSETFDSYYEDYANLQDPDRKRQAGTRDKKRGARGRGEQLPGQIQKLPELIIIGSKKCGTSAVKTFLKLNPNFAVRQGEPHFFDIDGKYEKGLDHYKSLMAWAFPNQTSVEGSPRYLYTSYVPQRVKRMDPDAKLAVILCDPVKRLVSEYTHLLSMSPRAERVLEKGGNILEKQSVEILRKFGGQYPSFEDIVFMKDGQINTDYAAVENGLYAQHLTNWYKYFPQKSIHIIDASVFLKTPWVELNRLARFAGVPAILTEKSFVFDEEKGFYCRLEKDGGCLPAGKGREHPEVAEEDLEAIRAFYKPHNEDLFEMAGRRFDWQ